MFETEIVQGMKWLDVQDAATLVETPWFWRVDTSEAVLNMTIGLYCVLGQSRPGGIGFNDIVDAFGWQWVADHGFALESWSPSRNYDNRLTNWHRLADEWRVAIHQRRVQIPA
jgi:hypothetical protein